MPLPNPDPNKILYVLMSVLLVVVAILFIRGEVYGQQQHPPFGKFNEPWFLDTKNDADALALLRFFTGIQAYGIDLLPPDMVPEGHKMCTKDVQGVSVPGRMIGFIYRPDNTITVLCMPDNDEDIERIVAPQVCKYTDQNVDKVVQGVIFCTPKNRGPTARVE